VCVREKTKRDRERERARERESELRERKFIRDGIPKHGVHGITIRYALRK